MADELTLEQEIEQAIEGSAAEDTTKSSEETTDTSEEKKVSVSEEKEVLASEGGETKEAASEGGETKRGVPEDTQEELEADTQSGDSTAPKLEGTQGEPEGDTKEPGINPETLANAVSSGLTLKEARSFGSEEALSQYCSRIQQRQREVNDWQIQQQQQAAQREQQQEPTDPFTDLPKLDPENYDSEVVEMFDRLTNIVRGQHEEIQEFRGQQEHAAAQAQEAGRREVEHFFDSEVENLGSNFEAQLGKGAYSAMDKSSQQAVNRDAIADHMSVMISGYRHHGIQVPPRSQVFKEAAKAVLSDRYTELASEEFTGKIKEQSTQTIQRVNKTRIKRSLSSDEEDEELGALLDSTFS